MAATELTREERDAFQRGRHLFEGGEVLAALPHFERLLATRRDFADVHYMVGLIHEHQGDLDATRRSLEEALRINPQYAEALLALRTIYERQGDFAAARLLADRAAASARPGDGPLDATTRGKLANLQAAVGDAYAEVGEWRDAIEAYRKALDRCPDFHDIRMRLGAALREAGLPDRALAEFRRILRVSPGMLAAAVQLGVTLYSLGRTPDAVREWQGVLERDPGRTDAAFYLRLVRGPEEPSGAPATPEV